MDKHSLMQTLAREANEKISSPGHGFSPRTAKLYRKARSAGVIRIIPFLCRRTAFLIWLR